MVILMLLLVLLMVVPSCHALYFDCYSHNNNANVTQPECETSEFCAFVPAVANDTAAARCVLSAESRLLVCQFEEENGQPDISAATAELCQAESAKYCSLSSFSSEHCGKQSACVWSQGRCIANKPTTTLRSSAGLATDHQDQDCCAQSWKVCSEESGFFKTHGLNAGKMHRQEQKAARVCGLTTEDINKQELCDKQRRKLRCTGRTAP